MSKMIPTMKHAPAVSAALGTAMLCCAAPVNAGFVGDTLYWAVSAASPFFNRSGSLTPNPTDSQTVLLGGAEGYTFSADGVSSTFRFEWNSSNNGNDIDVSNLVIEVTDIDWLPDPGAITDAFDIGGAGDLLSVAHAYSTTDDSVTITYAAPVTYPVPGQTFIEFGIRANHNVPEPASALGVLTGLFGLGAMRRWRRRVGAKKLDD